MQKQTIVHVIDSLGVGGAEKLLKSTIGALPKYEHVVCYLHQPDTLIDASPGVIFHCLHWNAIQDALPAVFRLRKIIKQYRPFLVHTHLLNSTWLGRIASFNLCALMFSVHSTLSEDAFKKNKSSLILEKATYFKSQILIGVSEFVLADYDRWVGIKGRSYVVTNFVADTFFNQQLMPVPAAGPLRLVAVGNLKALKNYDRLLSAMASLVADPVHLDIYGSGSLKESLQQRIKDEKLNVRLCGQVNDMAQILINYHMLIMPSLHEGFGLAPAEAMAVGLPVLLSELDVFKELFKSYPVYFDPVSPQSIATAIKYALKHKEALQERAIAAKAYATVRFSADRYCQQLDSIYQSVFARHIIKS